MKIYANRVICRSSSDKAVRRVMSHSAAGTIKKMGIRVENKRGIEEREKRGKKGVGRETRYFTLSVTILSATLAPETEI